MSFSSYSRHAWMFIIILFQGNEQVVFLATSPGLTSSYGPANPMPSTPMQFPAQGAPQFTGISVSNNYM